MNGWVGEYMEKARERDEVGYVWKLYHDNASLK